MNVKTRQCRVCREILPVHEFRQLRGWRRRRAETCEKCELEKRLAAIVRRRDVFARNQATFAAIAQESRRRIDPSDD